MPSNAFLAMNTTQLRHELLSLLRSGNDDAKIEAIYNTHPDWLFANNWEHNCFYYAHEATQFETIKLLDVLFNQYCADKIANKEWDKLYMCTLAMAHYQYSQQYYAASKRMFEYALFYLKKVGGPALDKNKLKIERELANCCIVNLEKLKITEALTSENIDQLEIVKVELQHMLTHLKEIATQTKHQEDHYLLNKYSFHLAKIHYQLAVSFHDRAMKALNDSGADKEKIVMTEEEYCFAQLHYEQAKIILDGLATVIRKNRHDKEMLAEVTMKLAIINDALPPIIDCRKRLLTLINPALNCTNTNEFIAIRIYELVGNRNTTVKELNSFLNENAAASDDNSNGIENRSTINASRALEFIISTGNQAILKTLSEEHGAGLMAFPTNKDGGAFSYLGNYTSPEVLEYLIDVENPSYANHPDKSLLGFFLDILAGRLEKIKDFVATHPNCLVEDLNTNLNTGIMQSVFALPYAYRFKQMHVIRYFENQIKLILKATINQPLEEMTLLYTTLYSSFTRFGWTDENQEIISILGSKMLAENQLKLNNLLDTSNEKTRTRIEFISKCQFEIAAIQLHKCFHLERQGGSDLDKALDCYWSAGDLAEKVESLLNNIDEACLLVLDKNMQILDAVGVLKIRLADNIKVQFAKMALHTQAADSNATSSIADNSIPLIKRVRSFGTSSNMYQIKIPAESKFVAEEKDVAEADSKRRKTN